MLRRDINSVALVVVLLASVSAVLAYPSEDAKLIASALKNLAASGPQAGNGQVPLQYGNATSHCSPSQAGRIRFLVIQKTAQLCTGSKWVTFVTRSDATTKSNDREDSTGSSLGRQTDHPAKSCFDILKKGHSRGDGLYWIKHPGYSGRPYRAYCDMTNEGGGWTLFATKVGTNYDFISNTFVAPSAHAVNQNGAGCIPSGSTWKHVLFRFRGDDGASRLVYNRYHGDGEKQIFNKALSCQTSVPSKRHDARVGGFVKHTPYENGGQRVPENGFHSIPQFAIETNGISEFHIASNLWLDLWSTPSISSPKYYTTDHAQALGTKCIAGVCYLNEPVWIMYR